MLSTSISKNIDYSQESEDSSRLSDLYAQAGYWHGTGRYRYDAHGKISDILAGIISDGGLVPHDDDWDQKRGLVQTISLARSRMYAKLYAVIYLPNGKRLGNEYLPRHLWGYYFFGTTRLIAMKEYGWFGSYVPGYEEKLQQWTRKVAKDGRSAHGIFLKGTDIPDNYPILIGIRQGTVQRVYGSRLFDLHEARSEAPITFADMTHIEVPEINVKETTVLLRRAGYNIPVISMEAGEAYCRTFSFIALVSGKPLVHKTRP